MAEKQAARITGIVLRIDERSGNKVQTDGTSKAWKMTTARVLVGGEDIADVTLAENQLHPDKGDAVDWLVRIGVGGKYLNVDWVANWNEEHSIQSS